MGEEIIGVLVLNHDVEPKTRNISAGMNIISQCPRGKKLPSNVDLTLESHTVIIFYILLCIELITFLYPLPHIIKIS